MEFITAVYFTENKKRKSIFVSNPGVTCIEACDYSNEMAVKLPPKGAKDIRARTYELGVVSHWLN
jgi:hypothetical protein